jgi:hypothetical protein
MNRLLIFTMLLSITINIYGQSDFSIAEAYQAGAAIAQQNKDRSVAALYDNLPDKFTDPQGKSYYTENPKEVMHYQDVTQGKKDLLETSGRAAIGDNEASKEVWGTIGKAKLKIDPREAWLRSSQEIIESAAKTTGVNSQIGIDCRETNSCKTEQTRKKCVEDNNETKVLKKICEKIPQIRHFEEKTEFLNCQKVEVRQGHRNYCSGGYRELLYTDMLAGPTHDDIFLCGRSTVGDDNNECVVGYIVSGRYHKNNRSNDPSNTGKGRVPKKTYGHIRFLHTYQGSMPGTIYNETTNEVVVKGNFVHGQIIDLPFSYKDDQVFRFDLVDSYYKGVVLFYVDRISKIKDAEVTSWQEINCYEN